MAIALIDTNILIDFFGGVIEASTEINYYADVAISNVTYMEFVVGLRRDRGTGVLPLRQYNNALALLANLPVIQIDKAITSKAIDVRANSLMGGKSIKLPDAIVFATASSTGRYMVTRDPKGFFGPDVRIPYQIGPNGLVHTVNPHPPI